MGKGITDRIWNIGLSGQTNPDEARYVQFTNVLTVINGLAVFSYVAYLGIFLPASWPYFTAVTTQFLLYCVALYYNHRRLYTAARCILSFNALAATVIESVITNFYCDIHFFLLIGVIFAFFLFPEKDRKLSYLVSSLFAVSFVAIELFIALADPLPAPPGFILVMKPAIRTFLLGLIFYFAYYAYRTIQEYQDDLAGENRKMENELYLARTIQQQLIPPRSPVDTIHSLYRPMHKVGGDFYDFIVFNGGPKTGLFLSDVSGHGVPAAFITSMIKTAILQSGAAKEDPASLLTYLNDIIVRQSGENFVTAFYGIYDRNDRSIRFSNAGHPFPFIIHEEGIEELDGARGLPLALFESEALSARGKSYTTIESRLEGGSKLLLYTDGLTEARAGSHDAFFEYHGLGESLAEHRDLPGDAFISSVYGDLVRFHGSDRFDDDICMICMDVH